MKRVFSLEKFIGDLQKTRVTPKEIASEIENWAYDCIGLTEEEAKELYGYLFKEEWLEEVAENEQKSGENTKQ